MAENSPPRDVANDHDPEVDDDGEDNPAFMDKAIPAPLSNPPISHRLSTGRCDSIEEINWGRSLDATAMRGSGFCMVEFRGYSAPRPRTTVPIDILQIKKWTGIEDSPSPALSVLRLTAYS